ncbi:serine dehydratase subunit alpha family protein [Flammeovirga sp. EKP202]|uniref:L-cysteine desulfidase family protein n=1 Tax=Flammeovirga sp. EKP202 TaxID=2770592 RepID=UPI00165FCDC6|nr:L-serine ammonia-lyase, iron-sulfur-dependent, subunit alpha [Flammeovirga sp. EKP202]MBD0400560.1 serine dehydratase subunit alpha family protein [Flammeovirga sp. EKP202]
MNISEKEQQQIYTILQEEIVPAEGCTEPIAIAFAAAKAVEILERKPEAIRIYVSGNILKNAKSVIVPNSGGMAGIEVAAAMGALAGDASKDLLVISNVSAQDMLGVRELIATGNVTLEVVPNNITLYVMIEVQAGNETASVEIKHTHTNITKVTKNKEVLIDQPCNDTDFNSSLTDRSVLTIKKIVEMANQIDIELVAPLFEKVYQFNSRIAEEGLTQKYGVNIGACIQENIKKGIYGDDQRNRSASYAAAGSDARMGGCALPVMTTSGSGNQGMTASLPIIRYCIDQNRTKEEMYRALMVSHLSTVHIKTNVGRLSAYCGVMTASAAVSGALVYLDGGSVEQIQNGIINTLGNVSGVICDGANASCASKIASGIYAAFDGAMLSQIGNVFTSNDGIVDTCCEETIQNVGTLAQQGMKGTDKTILDIMTK